MNGNFNYLNENHSDFNTEHNTDTGNAAWDTDRSNNISSSILDFSNTNLNTVSPNQTRSNHITNSPMETLVELHTRASFNPNMSQSPSSYSTDSNGNSFMTGIQLSVGPTMNNLNEEDMEKIRLFQNILQTKVENFLSVIETRRRLILNDIELDNLKLKQMQIANTPQTANYLNKLQKIRLRAIETETVELQRLRLKIQNIVQEYKKAISEYSNAKFQNSNVENPTDRFHQWIESLDLAESSKLTEGLQELSNYSKQLVNLLHSESYLSSHKFPNDVRNNNLNRYTPAVKSQNMFPLHELPSEILHLVLDRLSPRTDTVNLLTVCKLWALIIVKILYYRPHINKKQQLDLFLRTMKLSADETVFDYRLMIKRLNFSFVGDYIHDKELYYFVGCHNLERLTLVFCKNITSAPVSAVLKNCKFLQSVDITGIKDVQDNVFNTLSKSCPRVQGFYVPMAKTVSFQALNNFIIHAPILKRVKITGNTNINDDLVSLLADKCPMLVEVDITGSPNVHDESLMKLFLKLPQLREFRITYNSNITDKSFLELGKTLTQLPALRLIDLSSCENITDKSIEKLVNLAPKLRNVFLGKCSRITDTSLFNLARLGKNLQTIHFGHCFNITDQGVRVLVQSCPRIQYVDFACCTNLTNRTLYELSDLSKLKRIGLVKCSQMTDEGLLNMISLRGRNDSLERVHLSYCSNLTIYPIYELLMACPRLSHLSLTAVPSFLRPDITAFCRPAPSDFSDNQRQIFCVFSGKGVHKLRHYLMSLTTPTTSPQTDINEVLSKYIISNNLLQPSESLNTGIERISNDLNQDSAAILAASGLSQIPGLNSDFNFQNVGFEGLDNIFSWYANDLDTVKMRNEEINHLLSLVDQKFCDDPFNVDYDERDGDIVPSASTDLNSEMCHIVRKYHELDERVDDFEVNVASLARVQFQFTGFLLHEMAQIYVQMIELNRQITEVQDRVFNSSIDKDKKGLYIWKIIFVDKFVELLHKYKISTVVLRIYLRDSITLLTRQRELALASERNMWQEDPVNNDRSNTSIEGNNDSDTVDNSNEQMVDDNNINGNNEINQMATRNFWRQLDERTPLTPDQLRAMQFGLGDPMAINEARLQANQEELGDVQMDEHSETPDDDNILHNNS